MNVSYSQLKMWKRCKPADGTVSDRLEIDRFKTLHICGV